MLDLVAGGAGMLGWMLWMVPWLLIVAIPIMLVMAVPAGIMYFMNSNRNLNSTLRILVVDDDESSILSLLNILAGRSADVRLVESGESMLNELSKGEYDILFVDRIMPNQTGDVALAVADHQIDRSKKVVPVVFFTGSQQAFNVPNLSHFEVVGVWEKQIGYQTLENQVTVLLDQIEGVEPAA